MAQCPIAIEELPPFSSDKIRAKSARILLAAITRTILLPAGVRGFCDGFHSGVGWIKLG